MNYKEISVLKIIGVYILSVLFGVILSVVNSIVFKMNDEISHTISEFFIYMIVLKYICSRMNINLNNKGELFRCITFKKDILFSIAMAIIVALMSICSITLIFNIIFKVNPHMLFKIFEAQNQSQTDKLIVLVMKNFLMMVIIGPIVEEVVFRFVIFNKLKTKFNLSISILITSLLFAVAHAVYKMPDAFLFSMILCVIYDKSKNLLLPIMIHMGNNLIAVLPNAYSVLGNTAEKVIDEGEIGKVYGHLSWTISFVFIALVGILIGFSILLIKLRFKEKVYDNRELME